jgi:ribosomal protein S18 acetylase RimI-like enzyme
MVEIREAAYSDLDDIWRIFHAVVWGGDTYAFAPETTRLKAQVDWFPPGARVFVAILDGTIRGTYYLKPNQPGLGAHVANAAFMVDPEARGLKLGEMMGRHALAEAKSQGFRSMQFNLVVSTNEPAIRLWKKLGFAIVGTLPGAFHHRALGYVDAYVMFRTLD